MPFFGTTKGKALRRTVAAAALAVAWYDNSFYDALAAGYDASRGEGFMPVLGPELITNGNFDVSIPAYSNNFISNGDFSSGATGWTAGGFATAGGAYTTDPTRLAVNVGGQAVITNSATLDFCFIEQQITGLTIGVEYQLTFDVISQSVTGAARVNTLNTLNPGGAVDQATAVGLNTVIFTAAATSYWVGIVVNSTTDNATMTVDNLAVTPTQIVNGNFASAPTYGSNIILNGDMSAADTGNPATGWAVFTGGTSTAVISGGVLTITPDNTNVCGVDQSFTTAIGTTYELRFTSTTNPVNVRIGTAQNGTQHNNSSPTAGTWAIRFTATATTTWIRFQKTTNGAVTVDNVSVQSFTQPSGWTLKLANAGTGFEYVTIVSGALSLFYDGTNTPTADQSITTVVGEQYEIQWTAGGGGTMASIGVGTAQGGTQNLNTIVPNAAGVFRVRFRALATTTWIRFAKISTGAAATVDDVTVKRISNGAALGFVPYGWENVSTPFVTSAGRGNITANNIKLEWPITTEVGKRYRLRYHATWTGFLGANAYTATNTGGTALGVSSNAGTTNTYTDLSFVATTTTTYINFNSNNTGGTIDDVSLKEMQTDIQGRTFGADIVVNSDFGTDITFSAEAVTNGSFTTDLSGWTNASVGTGTNTWNASGRADLSFTDASNRGGLVQQLTLTPGRVCKLSFQVLGTAPLTVGMSTNGTTNNISDQTNKANAVFTVYFVAGATNYIRIIPHDNATAGNRQIDAVSVQEITNGAAVGWLPAPTANNAAVGNSTPVIITGGTLRLQGDNVNGASADQALTTVVGQLYELTVVNATAFSANLLVGTSQGGNQIGSANSVIALSTTTTIRFTALTTTTWIRLWRSSTGTVQLDSATVRPITAFGKYLKRAATYDEIFALTAAATINRTYIDASGVMKTSHEDGLNLVANSNDLQLWTLTNGATAVKQAGPADTAYTTWSDTSGTLTSQIQTTGATTLLPKVNQVYSYRLRVKKDSENTIFRRFDFALSGGTTQFVACNLNTSTGAFFKFGTDFLDVTDGGTEWIIDARLTNNGTNTGWSITAYPCRTSLALNDSNNQGAPQGSVDVRQAQMNLGSTILPFFNTAGVGANGLGNGANQPRLTYKNGKRQLRVESQQRIQSLANGQLLGAAIGTPGTVPTSWSAMQAVTNGLTPSIAGLGNLPDGTAYIDIRIQGTASAAFNGFPFVPPPVVGNSILASNGSVWSSAVDIALVGGSLANVTALDFGVAGRTTSGGGLYFDVDPDPTPVNLLSAITSSMVRYSRTRTITSALGASRVAPDVRMSCASGAVIDFTVRLSKWQLEAGAYSSDYIPNYATSGTSTRTAETHQIGGAVLGLVSDTNGSIVVKGQMTNDTTANIRRILGGFTATAYLAADATAPNNVLRSHNNGNANIMTTTLLSGTFLSGFGAVWAFNPISRMISGNGAQSANDAVQPGSRTSMFIGRDQTNTGGTEGDMYMDFIGFSPERISDTLALGYAQAA